ITFGEIITRKTGIPTKTVSRVDTVMVLEAVRRAILPDTNLDEIVASIDKDKVGLGRFTPTKISRHKKVIITLCITGEGTAIRIKRLIEKMIPGIHEKVEIIPVGIVGDEDIAMKIKRIKKEYSVSAIVGTIDPKDNTIPFIPLEEIINGTAVEKLQSIADIKITQKLSITENNHNWLLSKVIYEEAILVYPDCSTKNEILDDMVRILTNIGYVKDDFLLDVYKREVMGPTVIEKNIAIPHGTPKNVIKPAVGIAILKNPLAWSEGIEVDCVFMLALREDSRDIIRALYKLINNNGFMSKLKLSRNSKEARNIILEFLFTSN
ncbi:MAG TPA: PTS transporter subunit EIIA, partial [Thermoanaerobacterales bacterium]|nr:PTS transporter subunit EIIA [Thermoanaerobacterales bacterium]